MAKDGGEERRNGVVMAGRLTKLPSIRDLSFASRRPAGVGLAGIASNQFHYVSLPFASRYVFLFFPAYNSHPNACAGMLGAKSGGDVRGIKE